MLRARVVEPSTRVGLERGRALSIGLDAAGVAIVLASMVWSFATARVSGGDPAPVAASFLIAAVGVVIGRAMGWRMRWAGPTIVAVGAAVLFAAAGQDFLSGRPTSGPFGYANATGAMAALAATASLMVAADRRGGPGSGLAALGAVGFGTIPFLIDSLTPAVLVLALPIAALAARDARRCRIVVVVAATGFVGALLTTVVLGMTYGPERAGRPVDRVVDATITERRVVLWSESLEIMSANPLSGVGPGRFALASPTARSDGDVSWAHHELLQQGAEQGALGLVLVVAVFLWGFARLWAHPSPDAVTAIAALGLAILAIHASVDYVLRFPVIPLAVAILVGTGVSSDRWSEEGRRAW